jgi:hypothetical protein
MRSQHPGAGVDAGERFNSLWHRSSGSTTSRRSIRSSPAVLGGGSSNGSEAVPRAWGTTGGWWIVRAFMAVMMTVRVHQTPHQKPHRSKKSENPLEADEAPGQEVAGRSGADNPCSQGSWSSS